MKPTMTLAALLVLAIATVLATPFIGMKSIPLSAVIQPSEDAFESTVFWKIRIPRTCMAFAAGAALALSGMAFQAMFQNPLATPFTLGVSSGASLGAVLYVRLGMSFSILGFSGTSIAAFFGAILSILFVYSLTRVKGGFGSATLLLAGVAINFFFASLILFIQYTASVYDTFRLIRWMMGGLDASGYDTLLNMLPFVISGAAVLLLYIRELNLLSTGDDLAMSRGVDVKRTKQMLFFAASLMVGGVVAMCGPIGFIGIMVPHMCRLVIGHDHRFLAPASLLFGGTFLTLCDTVARTIAAPAEIPVGVITALFGGPFFLWLLLSRHSSDIQLN